MCEFCSYGPNSSSRKQHTGDQGDLRFAGFFSPQAIEIAIRSHRAAANNVNSICSNNNNNNDISRSSDGEENDGEASDDGT